MDSDRPAITPQQAALVDEKRSAFQTYQEISVGMDQSLLHLLHYEFLTLTLSGLPALPGLALRSIFYPRLFRSCGARPAFGRGVVVRGPKKISIGRRLLLDDYSVLDARGDGAAINIGDYACIGRFTTIAAKGGVVTLKNGANIGSYCRIATQSSVTVGESALIAAYCYIGPGNHKRSTDGEPLISGEMEIKGGVQIGEHAWVGAHSTILDGVSIGRGAIVGAHSLVRENVPDGAIVAGTPAKIIQSTNKV